MDPLTYTTQATILTIQYNCNTILTILAILTTLTYTTQQPQCSENIEDFCQADGTFGGVWAL